MSTYRNLGLFLALSALWGSAFMAIKAGLSAFPPVLFAALRYDVAGVVMLGYAVLRADSWRPSGRDEWATVGVGAALMIAAYHAFLFVGEQGTTSAAAAVIVSLSPVLTTVFARGLLPDSRLSAVGAAGILLGVVGVVAVAQPDPDALLTSDVVPQLLVFAAALSFALGSVVTTAIDAGVEIETMEAWSMLGGAGLMHVVSLGLGESLASITWSGTALWSLTYLSLGASAAGFLIYFDLLERLGPVEINLVSYVAPLFAALTGFLFLEEVVDAWTAVGFCCIFAGFVLIKRRALRREVPKLRAALSGEER
ncbi:DMT family transporter [Halosimplex salinum]|uniref:DMT family transporter n=1 Tax=Halosimplex salinum TaxID=1710538 RepID=UPI000F48E720|nr:DMT family transporter [Halosimplex salinum]